MAVPALLCSALDRCPIFLAIVLTLQSNFATLTCCNIFTSITFQLIVLWGFIKAEIFAAQTQREHKWTAKMFIFLSFPMVTVYQPNPSWPISSVDRPMYVVNVASYSVNYRKFGASFITCQNKGLTIKDFLET